MTAFERKDESWMNMRKQLNLLRFYRETEPIEDSLVRNALDSLKQYNCTKAYLFSSSGFTHTATSLAEGRQVELFGKEQLEQILQKSGV